MNSSNKRTVLFCIPYIPFNSDTDIIDGKSFIAGKEPNSETEKAPCPKRVKAPRRPKKPETEYDKTCPECKKVFNNRSAMRYHVKVVHSGLRPYHCSLCDKTFARKDNFKAHNHDKNYKPFLCTVCGKTFGRKSVRDSHERAHGEEALKHACLHCPKKFITAQQLKNHVRVHTGEKPYPCPTCQRPFARLHQLKTHMMIHSGEKPHACQSCGQHFRHISSKNNHKCDALVMF